MLSSAIRTTLVALILSALTASANNDPDLCMKVSGPDTVKDVKNLVLNVNFTNTGNKTLKLINEPHGPLSTAPTDVFSITNAEGCRPDFVGIFVKYAGVDFVAANGTDPNAFTVLAPGQSIVVPHNLSKSYDFTKTGEGTYKFEVANVLYSVDEKKIPILFRVPPSFHIAHISDNLGALIDQALGHASFVGCTSDQQSQLRAAIPEARKYVFSAISYLSSHRTTTPRFTTWFGSFQSARHDIVLSNYMSLVRQLNAFVGWKYDCSLTDCMPYGYGEIHLCDSFWTAPLTGTDSKAGTLVHESTHFRATGGTGDTVYGQRGCITLAKEHPEQAVKNADSHEYFAENNPPLA